MRIYGVISASLAIAFLAGCGVSSKATPANSPPAAIKGLATPTTVSVVTATNVH
jgi:uncharacterized lipoprotein YajG